MQLPVITSDPYILLNILMQGLNYLVIFQLLK